MAWYGMMALALFVSCGGGPRSDSCPDGTWLTSHMDRGTKSMGCTRKQQSGHPEGHGWQLSFRDAGSGYFGPDVSQADQFLIYCVDEQGAASLSEVEVGRLMRSRTFNPTCLERPMQPIWRAFDAKLKEHYLELVEE